MTLLSRVAIPAALIAALAACEKPGDRVEITENAPRSETRPVPQINVPSEERFAFALPQDAQPITGPGGSGAPVERQMAQAPGGSSSSSSLFDYEVPAGWNPAPASQFRDPNFTAGPNGEVECYVSVLQGQGGGLFVNANRWRGQFGQPPYTEDDFARLPRATILGREAVIVEFTGDFLAMGAAEAKHGYRLVGALLEAPMAAVFIKMTGPDAMVQEQKDNFATFAQSLRMKTAQPPDAAPPATDSAAPHAAAASGGFEWNAPDGWIESGASPMRLVTYRFGSQGEGECYVAVLPGAAGGRLDNFNRWLAQMGQAPLQDSELDLQPPVIMFGEEVPMLIAKGTYTGMGGESRPDHVLFGALAEVDGQSIFVKLVAPEAVANENMQKFAAFCASLRQK